MVNNLYLGQMASHSIFSNIWKGLAHPRAELVVWFVMIGRLKTKAWLHKMKILQANKLRCALCNQHDESVEHLFLECNFSWQVWCMCLRWIGLDWVIGNELKTMMESWFEVVRFSMRKKLWCFLFFVVIWSLWSFRNAIIFNNKYVNWDEFVIILKRNWCYKGEECVNILRSSLDKSHKGGGYNRGRATVEHRRQKIAILKEVNMRKTCSWSFVDYLVGKQAYVVGGIITLVELSIHSSVIQIREAKSLV